MKKNIVTIESTMLGRRARVTMQLDSEQIDKYKSGLGMTPQDTHPWNVLGEHGIIVAVFLSFDEKKCYPKVVVEMDNGHHLKEFYCDQLSLKPN